MPLHIDAAVAGDIADDNRFEVCGRHDRVAPRQWSQLEHGGIVHDRVDAAPATLDEALVRSIEALLAGR